MVFYDTDGREALRLRGYYPPYRFLAALEYVADRHYGQERFREGGAQGLNFAAIGRANVYHQAYDDAEHLSIASLPGMAECAPRRDAIVAGR